MAYYFSLQFKRINRHLEALGFNVVLAYLLIGFAFFGTSQLLFDKIKFAMYIYVAVALLAAYTLSEPHRNAYIQGLFHKKDYRIVRLIENVVLAFPFSIFLVYQNFYALALIVLGLVGFISLLRFTVINRFILPTPFYKSPFEFIVGFRRNVLFFVGYYMLATIAIYVDNLNLGIFALMLCLLSCLNFYAQPEPLFYVWTHALQPIKFLLYKIRTAIWQAFLISAPLMLALLIIYPGYWHIMMLIEALGVLYIVLMLLGKYAFYPTEVNLKQIIAVALSMLFPPFLIISLPYFFTKAKQNLALSII